jgi:cell division protein FtsW
LLGRKILLGKSYTVRNNFLMKFSRVHKSPDYIILVFFILLMVFGFVILASASSDLGKHEYGDAYYFLKHQAIYGLSFGVLGFLVSYFLDYRKYKKFAPLFLFTGLGILILTFSPIGVSSGGAQRWLSVGPITIQPSELLKLFFVCYLAAWLSNAKANRQRNLTEGFLPFLFISGIIGMLLIIQKSTSAAAILMLAAIAVYFIAGAKKKYLFAFIALGLVAFILLVFLTDYRFERIKTFLNPEESKLDDSYQINQALLTIGSGGWFGVGYGESVAKASLPERIGDSIFAIIAEEFGFIGSVILILAFSVLVTRIFILAKKTRDEFGRLLLVGFGTIIGVQAFIHVGANSGLIPLTGVPLPFISYGGTALAVFMTMTGVILNVSKHI